MSEEYFSENSKETRKSKKNLYYQYKAKENVICDNNLEQQVVNNKSKKHIKKSKSIKEHGSCLAQPVYEGANPIQEDSCTIDKKSRNHKKAKDKNKVLIDIQSENGATFRSNDGDCLEHLSKQDQKHEKNEDNSSIKHVGKSKSIKEHSSCLVQPVSEGANPVQADICTTEMKSKKHKKAKDIKRVLIDIQSKNEEHFSFNDDGDCLEHLSKQNKNPDKNSEDNSSKNVSEEYYDSSNEDCTSDEDEFDDFIVGNDVIEYEERPVNRHRRICDSETESEPSPPKKKKIKKEKNISVKDDSETDDEVAQFFEREALECEDSSESDGEDEEDSARFQGGSMLKGTNFPTKFKKTESSVFDLYDSSSDDRDGESDLGDFIVSDDESPSNMECLLESSINKRKRRRIKSVSDSDTSESASIVGNNTEISDLSNDDSDIRCTYQKSKRRKLSIKAKISPKGHHTVNYANKTYQIYRTPTEHRFAQLNRKQKEQ